QGRKLLDLINIPHILYSKSTIECDNIEYTLHHRSLFDAVKELLNNPELFKHCIFDYLPKFTAKENSEPEQCYGEQYSRNCW
ncbi:40060_t:CDS:1, partial [Gigaspora margarita]